MYINFWFSESWPGTPEFSVNPLNKSVLNICIMYVHKFIYKTIGKRDFSLRKKSCFSNVADYFFFLIMPKINSNEDFGLSNNQDFCIKMSQTILYFTLT